MQPHALVQQRRLDVDACGAEVDEGRDLGPPVLLEPPDVKGDADAGLEDVWVREDPAESPVDDER